MPENLSKDNQPNTRRPLIYNGREYRTLKHIVLDHIFSQLTNNGTQDIGEDHVFYLDDISDAYTSLGFKRPTSSSNFVLDITRKNSGIAARVPDTIRVLGYDLRKKTGLDSEKRNFAGEFVYVGVGQELNSWLQWPPTFADVRTIANTVPAKILPFITDDEAALFSVIEHCDVLSQVFHGRLSTVFRVQTPMKWQPNELDGLYFSEADGQDTFYLVEAKALSTQDDINLDQMFGTLKTMHVKRKDVNTVSIALRMAANGIHICTLKPGKAALSPMRQPEDFLVPEHFIAVIFDPPIPSWRNRGKN